MVFSIDWNGTGLIKRLSGFITEHEFMESVEASVAHPMWEEAKYVVNDFTHAYGQGLSALALAYSDLVESRASENPNIISVLYVSKDMAIKEFVEVLQGISSSQLWHALWFETLEEALEWATILV